MRFSCALFFAALALLTVDVATAQGTSQNPPVMTVAPSSLSFTVAANEVAFKAIDIANAVGSQPLIVHLSTQGSDIAAVISDQARMSTDSGPGRNSSLPPVSAATTRVPSAPRSVLAGNGDVQFTLDDGSIEAAYGYGLHQPPRAQAIAAVFINRFSAAQPMTIDSVSIYWPGSSLAGTDLTGKQVDLVAYYDANQTGDPTNAVRLGGDDVVTISSTDAFQTFATSFGVPGAGDVYIGFLDYYDVVFLPPTPFPSQPAAVDTTLPQQHSYVSLPAPGQVVDWNNLANNAQTGTLDSITGGTPAGNFMIRATATLGGGGGGPSCSPSAVDWLTISPPEMQINLGDLDVLVTVNPVAASLAPGSYSAQVCLNSNDPANPVLSIPVSLTVNEIVCKASDEIFCGRFDGQVAGATQPGVYTTHDEFVAQVSSGYYENTFDTVPAGMITPALQFSDASSGISYTIDSIAHNDQLWNGAGYVSTNYGEDAVLITFTGAPVTAVGGNFFAGNAYAGQVLVGNTVTITLSNGIVETFTTQSPDDFRGFTTSEPIHSIIIDAPDSTHLFDNSWPSVDNLIVGFAR